MWEKKSLSTEEKSGRAVCMLYVDVYTRIQNAAGRDGYKLSYHSIQYHLSAVRV